MATQIAARKLFATLGMLGLTASVLALFEGPHPLQPVFADFQEKVACQPNLGRRCPQKSDPAYCPTTYNQGDYYCSLSPTPSQCSMYSADTDCLSPALPVRGEGDPPPCGYKMDCKSGYPLYDPLNNRLECGQTFEACLELARPEDGPGLDP